MWTATVRITTADLLAVVTHLRLYGNPHALTPDVAAPPFVDVTGDDEPRVDLADVLLVVQALREQVAGAGESETEIGDGSLSATSLARGRCFPLERDEAESHDAVFATADADEKTFGPHKRSKFNDLAELLQ